ncbi:TOPRIM nucleotidyl transferase/hydrolase domain-containing protein [Promicromonospora kroppenstedtii]|uniref:TOPRIM nucleotidyl transferase/hydrolase domain-containing protein n=1 Tax=Promicromonospora kroppenstedtii TaxID=440482 RepID=UPI00056C2A42|nr:TOPRIM nucleotidyl transferase/hydrolase domain-containing protein [Promicromonospora kroppenstedtii]
MNLAGILAPSTSTAVLVEGESDRAAVEALAARQGLPLAALGVQVVAMGGITNIGHHLVALLHSPVRTSLPLRIGGLYDAAEERFVIKGLDRVGLRAEGARAPLSAHGFFRCDRDLEDELIRALGADAVIELITAEGELRSLERLQGQPAQRDRTTTQQLHRFFGSKGGRKEYYGRRLAETVPLDRVPQPLAELLRWAT